MAFADAAPASSFYRVPACDQSFNLSTWLISVVVRARRGIRRVWVASFCRLRNPTPAKRIVRAGNRETCALIVVAHPDDEVFCGGMCCDLAAAGARVTLVVMTRGEGARSRLDYADLGAERERELVASAKALGVSAVEFLDVIDLPPVEGRLQAAAISDDSLICKLSDVFKLRMPTLVVTHGGEGEYGHPAHLQLHRCVKKMLRRYADTTGLAMNAWRPRFAMPQLLNRTDLARIHVDGKPYAAQRLESIRAHKSQRPVFEQFVGGTLEDFVLATQDEYYSYL